MKKILLLTSLISSFLNSNSQVYTAGIMFSGYEDINPDKLMKYTVAPYTHQTYGIDLWDDDNIDIEFIAHGAVSSGGTSAYINVSSFNSNVYIRQERLDSVFVPGSGSWNITKVAKPLGTGEQINTLDAVWDNTMLYLTDHSGSGGGVKEVDDWVGGEKFLGLKYMTSTTTAYGWIRMECPNKDSCYVKDFSFSPPIVGLDEIRKDAIVIYPNPVANNFYLANINSGDFDISVLRIRDLCSKEITFTCEVDNNSIKIGLDQSLPDGFYMLEYYSNEQIYSRKLIKISE